MHMIGHQAVGPDLDRGFAAAFGRKIVGERIIGGFKEIAWRRLPRRVT
jgi:hypothetical protein